MKVCYIVSTLKGSGPINILYNIVKYLNREQFEPSIITLSPEPKGSRKKDFESLSIPVYSLNLSRLQGSFQGLKNLSELVNKIDPDIIHSHGHRADILNSKLNVASIKVSTIHNYAYEDYRMKYGKLVGSITAYLNIKSFRDMDIAVACSKSIAKKMENYNINLNVIQNGVDLTKFNPVEENEKIKLREKLSLPLDKQIFISIGSLIKRKNPLQIIEAVKSTKIDVIVIFLGSGPLLEKCRKLVKNDERFKFPGHVSNPDEYLKASDVFISASQSEGLPNTVLEALASGIPVLLSNIGPHQEILEYNQEAGRLFKLNDNNSLVNQMKKFLDEDYFTMEAPLSIVKRHLNACKMSKQYQDLYKLKNDSKSKHPLNLASYGWNKN